MYLVITWPKSRSLDSYLCELVRAEERDEVINFRVPSLPKEEVERCYIVHDGAIRGWNKVLSVEKREQGEVVDTLTGAFWPEGNYIVRDPHWNAIEPIPMKGFQGFHYLKESDV